MSEGSVSKKLFRSPWFIALGIAILVMLLFATTRSFYRMFQIRREIDNLREEAKRLQAQKLATLELLDYVKSPSFVEERARKELNLQKPGEQVAVIGPSSSSESKRENSTAENNPAKPPSSNPVAWWNYFFGN